MNYEKLGICITVIIVGCMLGLSTVVSGEIDLNLTQGIEDIPEVTQSTYAIGENPFFDWCYKMKIECA